MNENFKDIIFTKDNDTFSEAYLLLYKEVYHLARSLYRNTEVDPQDIVQDVFVKLLLSDQNFSSIDSIKSYIYVSLKNSYLNYLKHNKQIDKYNKEVLSDEEFFTAKMVETEVYSMVSRATRLLPVECAKVFKLTVDDWSVDEISRKLGKSKSTVYEHKQKAINILREKLL